ncbi:MAG: nucleotidyltransferase family protein [Marinobacter sp.]|uniref:nucleotidyltransferase family protein n=1 Tax=Marinobacter sp. TaxID=50741 RepID=UPI00299EF8DF|nr:nucleotidyltransferase family protein [Marinobacter sp.]MDX1757152.1 nucleotidyltransferase family protein [Marinobacter sp.]
MQSHSTFDIPVLLLAAGASSRLGRAKALLPWGQGILLDHAIGQARVLGAQITVVGGARYPLIRYRSRYRNVRWVYAQHWVAGQSASLSTGLLSMPNGVPGVFVLLVDQPLLASAGLRALRRAAQLQPRLAAGADYGGQAGAPAYLPRGLWPEILKLQGDQGAGRVLRRVGARRIPVAGVRDDLDSPADWLRLAGR